MMVLNAIPGVRDISPLAVKTTLVRSGQVTAVGMLAKAILEKDSLGIAASVLFGIVTVIAAADLGASEQNAVFQKSFAKEAKNERQEGEDIQSLRNQLKESQADVERIQLKLEETLAKNDELENSIKTLDKSLEKLSQEKGESSDEVAKLTSEIEGLAKKISELETHVAESKQTIDKLTTGLTQATDREGQLIQAIQGLQQELAAAKANTVAHANL